MNGAELRSLRRQLRWTQAEMGRELGKSRNTIGRYEAGDYKIPRAVVLAVLALKQAWGL